MTKDISIVLPIYNESGNIVPLLTEIFEVMSKHSWSYEVIAVDDGSRDDSVKLLKSLLAGPLEIDLKIIEFTRNFGQTPALACGIRHASGQIIVPMDADRQNDPADIPRLIEMLEQGFDVVSGWRRQRQDKWVRRLPSRVANGLINKLIRNTGVALHDYGCTLKAYRRDVLQNIKLYGDMHRFIPAFAGWRGAKVGELEVNHRARTIGSSNYGMARIWKVLLDLIAVRFFVDSFTKPMQFFGKYITVLFVLMWLVLAALAGLDIAGGEAITLNTYLLTIGLFGLAMQNLLVTGLIGEILIRNYFETSGRETYVVKGVTARREDC